MTSTKRTGSQKPTGIPGIGTGLGKRLQKHKGKLGLVVSSLPSEIATGPSVIGNKQDQHISLMGLTKRPTQSPKQMFTQQRLKHMTYLIRI